jgi:hypothetical protein
MALEALQATTLGNLRPSPARAGLKMPRLRRQPFETAISGGIARWMRLHRKCALRAYRWDLEGFIPYPCAFTKFSMLPYFSTILGLATLNHLDPAHSHPSDLNNPGIEP